MVDKGQGKEIRTEGSLADIVGDLYARWYSGTPLETKDLSTVQRYVREDHHNNVEAAAEALHIPLNEFKSFAGLNAFS